MTGSLLKEKGLVNHQQIKGQIKILPELEALIPPLREDEFVQLTGNILKEGCREALLVWDNNGEYILVDGHNRHRICTKHQVDFKINLKNFADLAAARDWMIDNQLGRRNLSNEQASYLRGMRYNLEKQEKGGYDKVKSKRQSVALTADRIGTEHNVSGRTVQRDAVFAEGVEKIGEVNPELKGKILAGDVQVSKRDIQKLAKLEHIGTLTTAEDIASAVKPKQQKTVLQTKENQAKQLEEKKQRAQLLIDKLALGKAENQANYKELVKAIKALGQVI